MTATTPLRWTVGDVTVTRVEELVAPVPGAYLLPDLVPEHVDGARPWIDPFFTAEYHLLLSVHSFVIETASMTIVVDTCVGPHADRPLTGDDRFLDRLDEAVSGGLDAVDVVICTHLHFDHVGWNTRRDECGRLVPAFANARYLVTRPELDADEAAVRGADERLDAIRRDSIQPIIDSGRLDAVSTDHRIASEVRLIPTPGHTPGHVSVLIESGTATALITGDAAHSPIQFAHPELAAGRVDHDSDLSTRTRHSLVDLVRDTGVLVLGTHFAPPTAGRIVTGPRGDTTFVS